MVLVQDGDIYIKLNDQGFPREGKKFDDGIRGQVKQIFIWHGEVIHSIQTTYQHNGDTLISPRRGGVGGRFDTVTLDEPLIWVSGHYGSWCWDPEIFASEEDAPDEYVKVIRSLKFGTARKTYGPFGREVGDPFFFDSGNGISGFHGGSGSTCTGGDYDHGYLHSIGVYIRSIAATLITDQPPVPMAAMAHASEGSTSTGGQETPKNLSEDHYQKKM